MDITTLLQAFNTSPATLTGVAGTLGAGAVISYALQVLRHFKGWTTFTNDVEKHATLYSRIALTALSLIVSLSGYILSHGNGPLVATVLKHFAFLVTAAHLVYWCTTQPAYGKVTKLLSDAENYRQITAPQQTSNTNTAAPSGTAANANVFPD